ncbi:MAG TPA: MBL fold metallo-hydrolase [Candidatus Scatomorpha pullistercoris]|uniref:MBL fold metallo-hydrolase n=1 Tax=Candidatus Scatomorpha pullistercoris TaxID=2840929 RepID=A0A9D1G736_9FIRM|nr:MBL fold metallo-hydrolase [Candidatus Scatomorpha pullistercoris]
MYELVQAGERSYYIDCPAKMGLYLASESEVWLIDSGNDKDAGRKVRQILDKNSWKLRGILVTHSNADHVGGCQYLQKQTGCRVFAPDIEAAFTRNPVLEPAFLYGGYPPKPLRHKFLMAQPAPAEDMRSEGFPEDIEPLPLPGHYFDMTGYRTPDGTAYIADCLSSAVTLEKYGFPFIYDVAAYMETLRALPELEAKLYVPAHAEATEDIRPLAELNLRHVEGLCEYVLDLCAEPRSFDDILKQAFDSYGLQLTMEQYVLVGSTIRSILAYLMDSGRTGIEISDNRLFWRKIT